MGFLDGSAGKESTCKAGDTGSIPRWEDPLEEENGTPLQYSYLKNPTDRGVWWAAVHRVARVMSTATTTQRKTLNCHLVKPYRCIRFSLSLEGLEVT